MNRINREAKKLVRALCELSNKKRQKEMPLGSFPPKRKWGTARTGRSLFLAIELFVDCWELKPSAKWQLW